MNDLLDLCRLNLMEERIADSPAVDRDATMAAIDYARRQIVTRIEPAELAPGAMERHIADNTAEDGTYPWTDAMPELVLPESNVESIHPESKP